MQAAQAGSREINKAWFFAGPFAGRFFGSERGFHCSAAAGRNRDGDFEVSVAVAGQLATVTFAAWAVRPALRRGPCPIPSAADPCCSPGWWCSAGRW